MKATNDKGDIPGVDYRIFVKKEYSHIEHANEKARTTCVWDEMSAHAKCFQQPRHSFVFTSQLNFERSIVSHRRLLPPYLTFTSS